jgi:hypothetical protein
MSEFMNILIIGAVGYSDIYTIEEELIKCPQK